MEIVSILPRADAEHAGADRRGWAVAVALIRVSGGGNDNDTHAPEPFNGVLQRQIDLSVVCADGKIYYFYIIFACIVHYPSKTGYSLGGISLPIAVKDFDGNNLCLRRDSAVFSAGKTAVSAGNSRDVSHVSDSKTVYFDERLKICKFYIVTECRKKITRIITCSLFLKEEKMKIIALANQKGGVGKSTTAINLGVGLAQYGKRVLLIDADSQGNLTTMLGIKRPDELAVTLATNLEKIIMDKPFEKGEGILHCEEGVDLIPSNIELSATEVNLVNTMSRETVLKTYLKEIQSGYDYILVDCMPSLGMLTLNALTAADSVIIPVQSHYLSAKGLEHLLKTIRKVQRQLNPKLRIEGILLTMTQSRTNFSKVIGELLRDTYGKDIHIFRSEIPFSIKGAEMSAYGRSIYSFEPKGKVAKAYEDFTREVLEVERQRKRTGIDFIR